MRTPTVLLALLGLPAAAHGQQIRTAADYDRRVAAAKAEVAALEAQQKTQPVAAPDRNNVQSDEDLLRRLAELEKQLQEYRREMPAPRTPPPQGTPPRVQAPVRPPQVGECRQPIPYEYYQRYYDYQPPPYPPPQRPQAPQQPQQPDDSSKRLSNPLHVVNPDGTFFTCDPATDLSLQFDGGNGFGGYDYGGWGGPQSFDSFGGQSFNGGWPQGTRFLSNGGVDFPTGQFYDGGFGGDPYSAHYGNSFGGSQFGFAPQRDQFNLSLQLSIQQRRRLLLLALARRRFQNRISLNLNAQFGSRPWGGGGWGGGGWPYQPIQPFSMPYAPTYGGFNGNFNAGFSGGPGGFAGSPTSFGGT